MDREWGPGDEKRTDGVSRGAVLGGPIEVGLHRPRDPVPVAAAPEETSPRRTRGRQE